MKSTGQIVISVETKESMEKHDCTKHQFRLLEEDESLTALESGGFEVVEVVAQSFRQDSVITIIGHKKLCKTGGENG